MSYMALLHLGSSGVIAGADVLEGSAADPAGLPRTILRRPTTVGGAELRCKRKETRSSVAGYAVREGISYEGAGDALLRCSLRRFFVKAGHARHRGEVALLRGPATAADKYEEAPHDVKTLATGCTPRPALCWSSQMVRRRPDPRMRRSDLRHCRYECPTRASGHRFACLRRLPQAWRCVVLS